MTENTTNTEDIPDPSEQMEQLSGSDSLIDRGVDDVLDEGYVAPDNWSPAQGFGNTAAEMEQGETLEQRIAQEQPETDPKKLRGPWNPNRENRQVGSQRAGRLIAPGSGGADNEAESIATDVGISGGAASAEEAAMHIISEEDLENPGDDED